MLLLTHDIKSLKVHPLVTFQILDRYLRRIEGHERVIGTLLGTYENGIVEVTSSFPVPYLEKGDEVAVGKDYHEQMYALHQRVNPKEVIVGWYTTSPNGVDISEQSCLIHEFFGSECDNPVHLVLDTLLTNGDLQVKGFVSSPLEVADCALENQFRQIPLVIETQDAEAIALDYMTKGCSTLSLENGGVQTLPSDLESLEKSISQLYHLIDDTSKYVDDVVSGKIPADATIGAEIVDALDAVPHINPAVFHKIFNSNLQDLLMVAYLASVTQAQLSMAEKLANKQ